MAMSCNETRPVYVLVGGVSHTPAFFDLFIAELAAHEIEAIAVRLPTIGSNTEGKSMRDEIQSIRHLILHLIDDRRRNVILVCHSLGGWPGSRAIKGLDKETRLAEEGKSTGIVEAVFISAVLIAEGVEMAHNPSPSWLSVVDEVQVPTRECIPLLFSGLDRDAQEYWFDKLEPHRKGTLSGPALDAPWHLSLHKTFIVTTADRCIPLAQQLSLIQGVVGQDTAGETCSIKTIKSDHEPFLSTPVELAKVLLSPRY